MPLPLVLTAPDLITRIREVLNHAAYSEPHILRLLGIKELPTSRQHRQFLPLSLWQTREETPLNTLVRLLLLHQAVPVPFVRSAVEPTAVEDWVATGLL